MIEFNLKWIDLFIQVNGIHPNEVDWNRYTNDYFYNMFFDYSEFKAVNENEILYTIKVYPKDLLLYERPDYNELPL
jgi:hypothetical protein